MALSCPGTLRLCTTIWDYLRTCPNANATGSWFMRCLNSPLAIMIHTFSRSNDMNVQQDYTGSLYLRLERITTILFCVIGYFIILNTRLCKLHRWPPDHQPIHDNVQIMLRKSFFHLRFTVTYQLSHTIIPDSKATLPALLPLSGSAAFMLLFSINSDGSAIAICSGAR